MRFRTILPLVAVSLAAVLLGTARADAGTTAALPITGYGDMLVDAAHGHVFVTGGPSSSSEIVVMNDDGTLDTTLQADGAVGGMAMSPDGSTLFVAVCGGEIEQINAATLAGTGSLTADVGGSCGLALAGGALWYADSTGHLGLTLLSGGEGGDNIPVDRVAAVPGHPGWLLVETSTTNALELLDVSDPTQFPTVIATAAGTGANVLDLAVAADGSSVVVSYGGPGEPSVVRQLALPTFARMGLAYPPHYHGAPWTAAAISPDGNQISVGKETSGDMFLESFATGATAPVSRAVATAGSASDQGFIRYSANGAFIYVVSPAAGGGYELHTLQAVPVKSFTLARSKENIDYGQSTTLTVHLGVATANRTVAIYRRQQNSSAAPVLVTRGTLGTGGSFSFSARPDASTEYTATWAGDSTHVPITTAQRAVLVHALVHRRVLGQILQAWVTPNAPDRAIAYVVQKQGPKGGWTTIRTGVGRTGTAGRFSLKAAPSGTSLAGVNQRVRFRIGASQLLAGSTSAWLRFRVAA